jgi:hypothetical protein
MTNYKRELEVKQFTQDGKETPTIRLETYIDEFLSKNGLPGKNRWAVEDKTVDVYGDSVSVSGRIVGVNGGQEFATPIVTGSWALGVFMNNEFVRTCVTADAIKYAETNMIKRAAKFLGIAIDNDYDEEGMPTSKAKLIAPKDTPIQGDKVLAQAAAHLRESMPAAEAVQTTHLRVVEEKAPETKDETLTAQANEEVQSRKVQSGEAVSPRFEAKEYIGTENGEHEFSATMKHVTKNPDANVSFDQLLFEVNWQDCSAQDMIWFLNYVCGIDFDFINTRPGTNEKFARVSAKHLFSLIELVKKAWVNGHRELCLMRLLWNERAGKKDQELKRNEMAPHCPLVFAPLADADHHMLFEKYPEAFALNAPKASNDEVFPDNLADSPMESANVPAPQVPLPELNDFGAVPRNLLDASKVMEYLEERGITSEAKFAEVLNIASPRFGGVEYKDIDEFTTQATEEHIMILCGFVGR